MSHDARSKHIFVSSLLRRSGIIVRHVGLWELVCMQVVMLVTKSVSLNWNSYPSCLCDWFWDHRPSLSDMCSNFEVKAPVHFLSGDLGRYDDALISRCQFTIIFPCIKFSQAIHRTSLRGQTTRPHLRTFSFTHDNQATNDSFALQLAQTPSASP